MSFDNHRLAVRNFATEQSPWYLRLCLGRIKLTHEQLCMRPRSTPTLASPDLQAEFQWGSAPWWNTFSTVSPRTCLGTNVTVGVRHDADRFLHVSGPAFARGITHRASASFRCWTDDEASSICHRGPGSPRIVICFYLCVVVDRRLYYTHQPLR